MRGRSHSACRLAFSKNVGLHPSLVAYDIRQGDGMNIGYNPGQTLKANFPLQADIRTTYLYAGGLSLERTFNGKQEVRESPIEFGGINLVPADPVLQHMTGLYGALIIEPEGSRWIEDPNSRASAVVTKADGTTFRELAILWQNDVENFNIGGNGIASYGAVNYRAEAYASRPTATAPASGAAPDGWQAIYSNSLLSPAADPQTPVFTAPAKMPTRFRMLFPGGSTNNGASPPAILVLQAHNWQEEPYTSRGTRIGNNRLSQHVGSQEHSAYEALNIVLPAAGGTFGVAGDYLYHSYMMEQNNGSWGLFRVQDNTVAIVRASVDTLKQLSVDGYNNPDKDGKFAASVNITSVER